MSIDNNRRTRSFSSDLDKARRTEPIVGEVTEGAEEAKYRYEICGQIFMNEADLEEHMKSHERAQEKVQQETLQPASRKDRSILSATRNILSSIIPSFFSLWRNPVDKTRVPNR